MVLAQKITWCLLSDQTLKCSKPLPKIVKVLVKRNKVSFEKLFLHNFCFLGVPFSKNFLVAFPGDYCQEIPQNKPWEKVPGPPILPPHLLQVILNKDTPLSVS